MSVILDIFSRVGITVNHKLGVILTSEPLDSRVDVRIE